MTVRFCLCLASVFGASLACSSARWGATESGQPALTFPARFMEGDAGASEKAGPDGDPTPSGGASESDDPSDAGPGGTPPASPQTFAPDPTALRTPLQWEYRIRHRGGELTVVRVRPLRFEQPVVTARRMGRYAIELWIGRELVDRVRFDFPLLAAEPAPKGKRAPLHSPPTLTEGADVIQTVLVPRSERATRAVLVDRATGQQQALPWPPDAPIEEPSAGQ